MFDEETAKRFAPFAPGAFIAFLLSRLLFVIVISFILLFIVFVIGILSQIPLIYVASFLLFLVLAVFFIWYSREFFRTFIYEPRKEFFFSRKGVITPSYTLILYKNIQDVHLEQTIFDRIFGLWAVKIYSATHSLRGSDHIFGLSYDTANRLKTEIFSRVKEVKHVVD